MKSRSYAKLVNYKRRPRVGDKLMLHGEVREVISVERDRVTFAATSRSNGSWYFIGSLMQVGAYYV